MLAVLWTALAVADRYGDPSEYLARFEPGATAADVSSRVPERFVEAEIHDLAGSPYSGARDRARRMGIAPVSLIVLGDSLWPFTSATVCYLYFDVDRKLIGYATSRS